MGFRPSLGDPLGEILGLSRSLEPSTLKLASRNPRVSITVLLDSGSSANPKEWQSFPQHSQWAIPLQKWPPDSAWSLPGDLVTACSWHTQCTRVRTMWRRENIHLPQIGCLLLGHPSPCGQLWAPSGGRGAPGAQRQLWQQAGEAQAGHIATLPQFDSTLNRCVSQIKSQICLFWLPCQPRGHCSQPQHWMGLKPKLADKTEASCD